MTIESGVLVGTDNETLHWHLPEGRSATGLPDDRKLWDQMWENRIKLQGFAHTHPGFGYSPASHTDITTFAAVEAALGRRLTWWIATADAVISYRWEGPDAHAYSPTFFDEKAESELTWLEVLRALSETPLHGAPKSVTVTAT